MEEHISVSTRFIYFAGAVIVTGWLCLCVGVLDSSAAATPTDPTGSPPAQAPTCAHISAKRFNALLKVRQQITGHKQNFRSRPVCLRAWLFVKKSIAQLRMRCWHSRVATGASVFDDHTGYQGDRLFDYSDSFAELAGILGGLKYQAVRWVHRLHRAVRAVKRDIGSGGAGIPHHGRTIARGFDAHRPLARKLGFSDGVVLVYLTKMPCRGVF